MKQEPALQQRFEKTIELIQNGQRRKHCQDSSTLNAPIILAEVRNDEYLFAAWSLLIHTHVNKHDQDGLWLEGEFDCEIWMLKFDPQLPYEKQHLHEISRNKVKLVRDEIELPCLQEITEYLTTLSLDDSQLHYNLPDGQTGVEDISHTPNTLPAY